MGSLILSRGQIWQSLIPFSDIPAAKGRPALVIGCSSPGRDQDEIVLMVPISTFDGDPRKARKGDIRIPDPAVCNLDAGSFVRARRLMALNPAAIDVAKGMRGRIDEPTMVAVIAELANVISCKTGTY